jgi:hypothetical protein
MLLARRLKMQYEPHLCHLAVLRDSSLKNILIHLNQNLQLAKIREYSNQKF